MMNVLFETIELMSSISLSIDGEPEVNFKFIKADTFSRGEALEIHAYWYSEDLHVQERYSLVKLERDEFGAIKDHFIHLANVNYGNS